MPHSRLSLPHNNAALVRMGCMLLALVSQACFVLNGEGSEPLEPTTGLTLWKHTFNALFGLSGFFILASWERHPDAVRFIAARVLRIMPALAVAVLVTLGLGAFLTTAPWSAYAAPGAVFSYIVGALFLADGKVTLPGLFGPPAHNELVLVPLWALKYLVVCYAAVLAMGLLSLTRAVWPYALGLAALLLIAVAQGIHPELINPDSALAHGLRFGSCFFLGMCCWRFQHILPWNPVIFAGAVGLLGMAFVFGGLSEVLYYVLEIYVVLWLSLQVMPLDLPFTEGEHDFTLGLSLYGWFISQSLRVIWPQISLAPLIIVTLCLALAAAVLSWLFIEQPTRALLARAVPWLKAKVPVLGRFPSRH